MGLLLDRFMLDVSCSESAGVFFYDGIATFQIWFQGQTWDPTMVVKPTMSEFPKKQLVQHGSTTISTERNGI